MNPIKIHSQPFHLHPTGAAFWEAQNALLIADVHLGKISHFRKHGSAVPAEAIRQNFDRLEGVITEFSPEKIYFLGDLFHSALNQEWPLFDHWQQSQTANITLIVGNHDIISTKKYEGLGIRVVQELKVNGVRLTHRPEEQETDFNICGHIHPGFRLTGPGKQQLKLRCFFQRKHQLILPAFGNFTGNFYVTPEEGETIYVCGEDKVILVN